MNQTGEGGNQHSKDGDKSPETATCVDKVDDQQPQAKGRTSQQPIPQQRRRFWRDWEPITKFTGLLVIFTAIYSAVAIIQVYMEVRPYVGLLAPSPTADSNTTINWSIGGKSTVQNIIMNAGKMPAFNAIMSGRVFVSHLGDKIDWDRYFRAPAYREMLQSGTTLLPLQQYPIHVEGDDVLDAGLDALIMSGRVVIVHIGGVHYLDFFWRPHRDRFCEILFITTHRVDPCKRLDVVE